MPRFLVTAGNTREMIDRVRDWGNIFTGNTGFSIAEALRGLGAVDLFSSNPAHLEAARAAGMGAVAFRSHADLMRLLEQQLAANAYDAIFMTAAVADYAPQRTYAVTQRERLADGTERWIVRDVQAGKVKSDHDAIAILGERTAKDPRFAVAMTEHAYYVLTGRRPLLPPKDIEDPLYPAKRRAYAEQRRHDQGTAQPPFAFLFHPFSSHVRPGRGDGAHAGKRGRRGLHWLDCPSRAARGC